MYWQAQPSSHHCPASGHAQPTPAASIASSTPVALSSISSMQSQSFIGSLLKVDGQWTTRFHPVP